MDVKSEKKPMKEQQTFTPGPWSQGTVGEGPHATNVVWLGENTDKRIEVANRDNNEANARLIAAAPELYEQCKRFEKVLSELVVMGEADIRDRDKLRGLLAKVDERKTTDGDLSFQHPGLGVVYGYSSIEDFDKAVREWDESQK